jgi:MYXO-CTERM domain-containing protein
MTRFPRCLRRSSRSWSFGAFALVAGLGPCAAAAEPVQWLAGPWALDASPARNPDVDARDGQIHIVYRVRDGGIGHITGASMGMPTTELVIPGSVATAAVTRAWNFPRVAVDDAGAGHVVWGPLSSEPLKGSWYARIDADGVPVIEGRQLTGRWVEDVDVATVDGQVHVLVNAIGDAPGLYDWTGAVETGPTAEVQVSAAGSFRELSLHRHEEGLSAIGRFTQVERVDLGLGQGWGAVEHHDDPSAPITSIGYPRLVQGSAETWAAIAWIDATPTSVVVQQDLGPWTTLSADPPFDPADADGGSPSVSVARDREGRIAVAWLAEAGDRLHVALAAPAWSEPIALPDTADVTSFEICPEGDGFRVVVATDDGTLLTGRFGVPAPAPGDDETGDDGGDDPEPEGDDSSGAGSDGEASSTGEDLGDTSTSGDLDGDAVGLVTGWSSPRPAAGCSCHTDPHDRTGWLPLAGLLLLPLGLLRSRPRRAVAVAARRFP